MYNKGSSQHRQIDIIILLLPTVWIFVTMFIKGSMGPHFDEFLGTLLLVDD